MSYYIYENWQAKDFNGPKIHQSDCGFCQNGQGMIKDAEKGKHGVWIGPFDDLEFAREYYRTHFTEPIIEDSCVRN